MIPDFPELEEKLENCPKPLYSRIPCEALCEKTCWELKQELARERLSKIIRSVWGLVEVEGVV